MRFKNILASLLIIWSASASAGHYTYTTVPGDPIQARIYTLDNGLKIYLSVNKETPRIQTYIAVRTGSRNDPAETTGLAHYLEHLMFKGTTHFGTSNLEAERPLLDSIEQHYERYRFISDPQTRRQWYHKIDSLSQLAAQYNIPNEYDKMMSAIGSQGSNAYTSNDVTCYVENIPSNELDTWARVQADRFRNMVIRGFHTELEAVYEEFNINMASDNEKLWEALFGKLFPTHPYGTQSTIGRQEHLKNPSITNIKQYFHKYYQPNNVAICMAGDLDPDITVSIIDKYFGSWKSYGPIESPQYASLPNFVTPQDTSVTGQEAPGLVMAWRFDRGNTLQGDTLNVISEILNNGNAGLFDIDLNQQMKVQYAGCGFERMHDYSFFIVQAQPKEGQSLDEARSLVLAEIGKLKRGEFSESLLPAVLNNMKRNYYEQIDRNSFRTNEFVDAFINEQPWEEVAGYLNRIEKLTKQDITAFANRHFNDGYACVYKLQGIDTTFHAVEKPAITPIPTNNDKESDFKREIVNTPAIPIQPRFIDFQKDLTTATTKKGLPVLYKQNTDNDLFRLQFIIPFGTESDPLIGYAADYLDYVGTAKLSAAQVKTRFYGLACDYSINETADQTTITLSGLNKNLPHALTLLCNLITGAKADQKTYNQYVEQVLKSRDDNKSNQQANFAALRSYAVYGPYNAQTHQPKEKELKAIKPRQLLDLLKTLSQYKQTVLYYGPSTWKELDQIISKSIKTPKTFKPLPASRPYVAQPTQATEVMFANYEAPNAYLMQYHNEGKSYDPKHEAIIQLFNAYFGGGMNAIVFQELREARGLAYSAGARYGTPSRPQDKESFTTNIITQTDKLMDCVGEFNNLLDSMPLRPTAFSLVKQNLIKDYQSQRTTKFNILSNVYWYRKMGFDHDIDADTYKALPSLTPADLMRFARENIARKPYRYIILGNEKSLDFDAIGKIAPIKRLTQKEIFGY